MISRKWRVAGCVGIALMFGTAGAAPEVAPTSKIRVEDAVRQTRDLLGGRDARDILGITHTHGMYAFGNEPSILEGAKRVESMGCRILKMWFTRDYGLLYGWNAVWPGKITSLRDLATTPYYSQVFSMPFHTIVLEAEELTVKKYCWKTGFTHEDKARVHDEIYAVSKELLTRYRGTGKTFILQNWESDNSMKYAIGETNLPGWKAGYAGFIVYMETRQKAIEEARRDFGTNGVMVVHALEVNFVPPGFSEAAKAYRKKLPLVVDEVVPKTRCDLYSLSTWETWSPGTEDGVYDRLQYLASKAPPSAIYGTNNLMVGEFGTHEEKFEDATKNYPVYVGDTSGAAFYANHRMVNAALRAGVRYIIHWELYANELRGKKKMPPGVMATAQECAGNWLIRPDGSTVPTYDYFKSLFSR